ncbi:2-dehydropantoate 2-reductase [Aquabacterium sp. OR-4]|uniref:2-dehydropantoate 2-reductase n=1 Tax=Aquabacterium sp. OR-4 TaxID=2978127 RepID=UPI0028CAE8B8|nr:2-dehydropantoate 2-reductase [Aquabacterium sp. OR-4]MDT7835650.1 2-dehydropantoate 2-reductase [Aquabacterium sp. OR-4]
MPSPGRRPTADDPVLVMGAGSIGAWLGGRLAAADVPVVMVGRPRTLNAMRAHGLTLTDADGGRLHLPPARLTLAEAVPEGLRPGLALLCVKSAATSAAAAELGARLPAGTPVVSMQNGLGHAARIAAAAPRLAVVPGMVPYNVAELSPGHLHRGTSGRLAAQAHPALAPWLPVLQAAGLAMDLHADLTAVQWGKLLLNLNNAVNALSGLPLRAQLLDRDLRHCTAALMREALAVLGRSGIRPARLSPLPPALLPAVLDLPTPMFRAVAARMLRIDDKARSSMADDLALGRVTEVEALNGEVLRLAASLGLEAPLNARLVALVHGWSRLARPLDGRGLRAALGL